jgi:UDP-N-acetyl-alpha-D-muramoyl-L-alanyl-L-glutamate epimerase
MPGKLLEFRKKHPAIRYVNYSYSVEDELLFIRYLFILDPGLEFRPSVVIPCRDAGCSHSVLDRMVFLLGMVELISYWKCACPGKVIIECGALDEYEKQWWEHLARNGLGEFFFQNRISPGIDFEIICASVHALNSRFSPEESRVNTSDNALVMVGGGKDSIVTLECVKELYADSEYRAGALCLNPIQASLDAISLAGYQDTLTINRTIDPLLFDLNKAGYLNGHTPFSALLAFAGSIAALSNGYSMILASNESSASEGNVMYEGVEINHQYSKSFEFEKSFREYLEYQHVPVSYFSFLRPLNEIQITGLFSQFRKYHPVFRSCNMTQTLLRKKETNNTSWCGTCPKCVFTFVCLSCFLSLEKLEEIFGDLIVLKAENQDYIQSLLGLKSHKPFECVGTPDEVLAGLQVFLENASLCEVEGLSFIQTCVEEYTGKSEHAKHVLGNLLSRWNEVHFLPPAFFRFLHDKVSQLEALYGT